MTKVVGLLLISLLSSASAACPAGTIYESSYNKCYKYSASSLNFLSAEKACQTLGGSLVAVQNAYENSYISGIASASSSSSSFWIGANLLMATYWSWTSGYNGTYMNFAPGQPSDPSIYQCAAVRDVDNAWTKELCSTQKPYMCQIDPNASVGNGCSTPSYPMTTAYPSMTTTLSTSQCTGVSCDFGYTLNPAACKCYKHSHLNAGTPYSQCLASCRAENATFPIVRNQAENVWLSNFVKNSTSLGASIYLDLQCSTTSAGNCTWSDGSSLIYSNWAAGSPTFGDPFVYLDESDTFWLSWPSYGTCDNVVCEKPASSRRVVEDFRPRPHKKTATNLKV